MREKLDGDEETRRDVEQFSVISLLFYYLGVRDKIRQEEEREGVVDSLERVMSIEVRSKCLI